MKAQLMLAHNWHSINNCGLWKDGGIKEGIYKYVSELKKDSSQACGYREQAHLQKRKSRKNKWEVKVLVKLVWVQDRTPALLGPAGMRPDEAAGAQSFLGPTESPSFQPLLQPAVTGLLRNQPNDISRAHSYARLRPLGPEMAFPQPWQTAERASGWAARSSF